ncbi:MAG: Crp/Fnr family transcriptional regulator [Salinivirgaceae bacterium]|nr:Crp/Fnr family transcriptional regulator [Salinivirgaceae bacterium]
MVERIVDNKPELTSNLISADNCLDILTEKEQQELYVNSNKIEFEPGETIIKKGFVASNVLYLERGLAKLDISSANFHSTVNLIAPKSFVGIICTFASHNFDFSAIAIEKTTIISFEMTLFEKFVHQNGEFACRLIRHMSGLTNVLVHRASRLAQKNIDGALSIILIEFSIIYKNDSFAIPLNRKELAQLIGYSKESVINTLSKFNKEGIISVHEKKITILDKNKLSQIAEVG